MDGCDIRCSNGPTSTPCDAATGRKRQMVHLLLDPLWDGGCVFAAATSPLSVHRGQAYRWLAAKLGIPQHQCHIGYFDEARCDAAIGHLHTLLRERNGGPHADDRPQTPTSIPD